MSNQIDCFTFYEYIYKIYLSQKPQRDNAFSTKTARSHSRCTNTDKPVALKFLLEAHTYSGWH